MGCTLRPLGAALALALLLPLPSLAGEVVVKPGETLSEIAERYGVSVQRLMQLNGLKDPKDLWAGSRIQVPGAGGSSSGGGRSGGGSGAGGSGSRGAGNYTVKPGETLSEIAERYNVSVERLLRLNGLKDGKDLWAGSRITVPSAGAGSSAAAGRSAAAKPAVNRAAKEHKVQPGETLSGIADLYGIPQERLVALNGLSKPDQLVSGSTLKLRGSSSTAAASAKPAVKPAAKPTAKPTSTAAKPTPPRTAAVTGPAVATATPAPATAAPAARPAAPKPTQTATASAKPSAAPAKPDWRTYGPLQVDWANWQSMGGSFVTPSLNSEGQPLYLAVNCTARRINATGQSGAWRSWDAPQSEFETQLLNDLCRSRGS